MPTNAIWVPRELPATAGCFRPPEECGAHIPRLTVIHQIQYFNERRSASQNGRI
jgi:hypothetical protein